MNSTPGVICWHVGFTQSARLDGCRLGIFDTVAGYSTGQQAGLCIMHRLKTTLLRLSSQENVNIILNPYGLRHTRRPSLGPYKSYTSTFRERTIKVGDRKE